MRFTAAVGLPTAHTRIADFSGRRALVVERFDRRWTRDQRLLRVPQEDCCQALSVPPTLKYEADGGPGMVDILHLLNGSDEPEVDRRNFMKAQIVFWLLGATDGHAKNCSIFLGPGGRFRMTPLYDVMSVQPAVDAGQMRHNKMKMALAVGRNRHYVIHTIVPRHFVETGEAAGIPAAMTREIVSELAGRVPAALETASRQLPPSFPGSIVNSISNGVLNRARRLEAVEKTDRR